MKNILKVCLVLSLCACMLLVAGCKKKADENVTNPSGTQPATTAPQGSNPGGENPGTPSESVPSGTQNPEGDPFDGSEPTGPVVDIEAPDDSGNSESTPEPTSDFEVDFGDLT